MITSDVIQVASVVKNAATTGTLFGDAIIYRLVSGGTALRAGVALGAQGLMVQAGLTLRGRSGLHCHTLVPVIDQAAEVERPHLARSWESRDAA